MKPVLIDTGPPVAVLSQHGQYHAQCVQTMQSITPPMLTCWPVITEAAWLLRQRPKGVERLLKNIADRFLSIPPMENIAVAPEMIGIPTMRSSDSRRMNAPAVIEAACSAVGTPFDGGQSRAIPVG